MPSSTPKQARTMAAASHNPKFAKMMGIPVSVARDFNKADAGTGIINRTGLKKRKAKRKAASR